MTRIVSRTLRWDPLTGADGFRLYWGPSDTVFDYTQPSVDFSPPPPIGASGKHEVNLASIPALAALPEGTYDLAVTGFDAAGNEGNFAEVENVPLDFVAPGAVTGLEVVAG